jgi:hypothetical protein
MIIKQKFINYIVVTNDRYEETDPIAVLWRGFVVETIALRKKFYHPLEIPHKTQISVSEQCTLMSFRI